MNQNHSDPDPSLGHTCVPNGEFPPVFTIRLQHLAPRSMAVTPTTQRTNSDSWRGDTAMMATVAARFPTAWMLMLARVPAKARLVISQQMMFPVRHQFNAANKLRNQGTWPSEPPSASVWAARSSKLMDKEILAICHRTWKSNASTTKRFEKVPKAFLIAGSCWFATL